MAKTTKNAKAVATVEKTTSALTTGFDKMEKVSASLAEEMNGLTAVFDRIKMPIGGVTFFDMPGDEPDSTETVKEFEAVILHHHPMRAFYREPYTGGNNPPNCGSLDGMVGKGEPGGICDHCKYNQFGTTENGGKACKERHRLFLLQEGELFPKILSLPTGSLKEFSRYIMHCIPAWKSSSAGLTHFSLTKAVNKGGIVYTKAQFRMGRALTAEELASIKPLVEQVKILSQEVIDEPMEDDPSEMAASGVGNVTSDTNNAA